MTKKLIAGAAALGMLAFGTPAFADMNSSSMTITTQNRGSIDNTTKAKAETGGNFAGAGYVANGVI